MVLTVLQRQKQQKILPLKRTKSNFVRPLLFLAEAGFIYKLRLTFGNQWCIINVIYIENIYTFVGLPRQVQSRK